MASEESPCNVSSTESQAQHEKVKTRKLPPLQNKPLPCIPEKVGILKVKPFKLEPLSQPSELNVNKCNERESQNFLI